METPSPRVATLDIPPHYWARLPVSRTCGHSGRWTPLLLPEVSAWGHLAAAGMGATQRGWTGASCHCLAPCGVTSINPWDRGGWRAGSVAGRRVRHPRPERGRLPRSGHGTLTANPPRLSGSPSQERPNPPPPARFHTHTHPACAPWAGGGSLVVTAEWGPLWSESLGRG